MILGISPGTRSIGTAVMRKGKLVEWKVKTFKGAWNKKKLNIILAFIEEYAEHYDLQKVVLKKVQPDKSSRQLDLLVQEIFKLFRHKKISVISYSLEDLQKLWGRDTSGKAGAHAQARKYPQLRRQCTIERQNRREYYTKMFEAIAVIERSWQ